MQKNLKATVVPTVLSSKGTLWCVLFVGYFFAILGLYNFSDEIRDLSAELKKPVVTTVETDYFSLVLPAAWQEYAVTNSILEIRRVAGQRLPFIQVIPEQDPAYAFVALDTNPSVLMRRYEEIVFQSLGERLSVHNIGSDVILLHPGCQAVINYLEVGEDKYGYALFFYDGNVRFIVLSVVEKEDQVGIDEMIAYFGSTARKIYLPERPDAIDRPLINSNAFTSEHSRKLHEQVNRELALWNLFRGRAEVQPEAYLEPAIQHYRKALELKSSLREETDLLMTDDFKKYQAFLAQRRVIVREWFIRLDKLIGMKNVEAAKAQAQYIIEHATLVDESLDARRASDILASLNAPPRR